MTSALRRKIGFTALAAIHVRDNGIGMSREFQEHLFESFSREETSTVSGIQGTGLGMAIKVSHMVQEIARYGAPFERRGFPRQPCR